MSNASPGNPDPQAQAVYAWERAEIETVVGAQIMSRDQAENLVRRAAAHLRMRAPRIVYATLDGPTCLALPDRHELFIASWGRGHVTLLHELAHLDTWRLVMTGEAPHGPCFVGSAMALYNRFIGIPFDRLERGARRWGLDFVPPMRPALGIPPA